MARVHYSGGFLLSQTSAELQITPLLQRWQDGDRDALDALVPLIYHQLCLIARKHMRGERNDHTFSTVDLVQEAFVKLVDNQGKQWAGRVHFFAVAGRAMRHILINHAAGKNTQKRGGSEFERAVVDIHQLGDRPQVILNNLDEAIERLALRDQQVAMIVELRYFCGFTIEELAEILPISPATIKRKLELARVWLDRFLN